MSTEKRETFNYHLELTLTVIVKNLCTEMSFNLRF